MSSWFTKRRLGVCLLAAGINDWGGVSPLTPDFINPEAPWPHLEHLRSRTESKGQTLQQRIPAPSSGDAHASPESRHRNRALCR